MPVQVPVNKAIFWLLCLGCLLPSFPGRADDFQGSTHMVPFDDNTLTPNYNQDKPTGPVARLQAELDSGKIKLKYDDKFGYLPAVLAALKVPASSQILVFSKTSFQRDRISPATPRALFMNDDVYVGFIPGAPLMEISMADPKMGGVFYTLDQTKLEKPRLVRNDQCLECHASSKTMGVPGHVLRSMETDENGAPDLETAISEVDDRTPLADRWGGYYVTGTHGKQTHHGNLIGKAAFERQKKDPNYLGNITNLSRFISTDRYLEPSSDIVSLLVLEHQTHMHNFIARLNYETRIMLQSYGHIRYLGPIEEGFLKYMLFTEEAPLTDRITGSPEFERAFENEGPKDHLGRSLRQFDLQTRLFKYPCSYLIYSEAFDSLPEVMKNDLYQRLWNILTGKNDDPDFARIPMKARRAILEILADTKPGLPAYWKTN